MPQYNGSFPGVFKAFIDGYAYPNVFKGDKAALVGVSKGFRGISALPFFLYNRNFNNKWGIESLLPGLIYGRYNLNARNILLGGVEYASQSYRLSVEESGVNELDYAYNHSELQFAVRWEHQFVDWLWASLKFGYQMNFSSD